MPTPPPTESAIDHARKDYDQVLVGIGPEWGFSPSPIGIASEPLLQRCPPSLLIVRAPAPHERRLS